MRYLFLLAFAFIVVGCTVTKIKTPYWEMNRTSLFQKMDIGKVLITTNGTGTLEGYKNDGGLDAISVITAAAVSSAVNSVKP